MSPISWQLLLLGVLAVALYLARLVRRSELVPCAACGMSQLDTPRVAERCATCHQRERLGVRATQFLRDQRAQADAAVWRR